jgi:hypothetical protein
MPVLRYHVGAADALSALGAASRDAPVLVAPAPGQPVDSATDGLRFSWADGPRATMHRLEVRSGSDEVLAAYLLPGVGRYAAPPWFIEAQRGKSLRWRVLGLDGGGRVTGGSDWREFTLR